MTEFENKGSIITILRALGFKTSDDAADSTDTLAADTQNGTRGTSEHYAKADHAHPQSDIYATSSHTHSNYVNPTIADNLTTNDATQVLSAKQGKLLNDNKLEKVHSSYKGKNVVTNSSTGAIEFEDKPTIPSKISDLTNDSNFIETSSTTGLVKNDGSIDTSTYLTSHQSLTGYLQTTDVKDNLTSTDTDKPLSAKQGKVLNDNLKVEYSFPHASTTVLPISPHYLVHSNLTAYINLNNVTEFYLVYNLPLKHFSNIQQNLLNSLRFIVSVNSTFSSSSSLSNIQVCFDDEQETPVYASDLEDYDVIVLHFDANRDTDKLYLVTDNNPLLYTLTYLFEDIYAHIPSLSGYLQTSDIVDNLTTNNATKPLSAKQGKALNDLIGSAITYINQ